MTSSDKAVLTLSLAEHEESKAISQNESIVFQRNNLKPTCKHLFTFTKLSHIPVLVTALFTSCLAAAIKTSLAVILGKIFDVVALYGKAQQTNHQTLVDVSWWCMILAIMGAGAWGVNAAYLAFWITFGEQQARSCRMGVFCSLIKLKNTWFDVLPNGIPSLLTAMQTQTRELQMSTSQVFGMLICDALTSIASISLALYYSWKLTLVLLATLPISLAVLSFASRNLEQAISNQKENLEQASLQVNTSVATINHVKVFNGYNQELSRYTRATTQAAKAYFVQARCNAIQMGYVGFWVISMFVIGFWYGLVLVHQGLAPGHVLTTFYSVLAAFQGLEALLPHWLIFSKGIHAGAFLETVRDEASDPLNAQDTAGTTKLDYFVGDIQLHDVSFAYPSNPLARVLKRSSFYFPAGQTTFVVGRSGSGKSTLGQLIARVYEPLTGEILFDGQFANSLDPAWLRNNITLVQQLSIAFQGSFFENVALGHDDPSGATQVEVEDACGATNLLSVVESLPEKFETLLGDGGQKLSGGQLQRLTLARAKLRDPKILILDEVTSALDQRTKDLVMSCIRTWRRGKTTIIITHDISQIENDDFVYQLQDGYTVQQGFKRDLRKQHGSLFQRYRPTRDGRPDRVSIQIPPSSNAIQEVRRSSYAKPQQVPVEGQWRAQSSYLTPRASIGRATEAVLRLRSRRNSAPMPDRMMQTPSRRASAIQEDNWDAPDPQRFSRYVNERFDSPTLKNRLEIPWTFETETAQEPDTLDLRSSFTEEPPADKAEDTASSSLLVIMKTVWPSMDHSSRTMLIVGLGFTIISAVSTPVFAYCLSKLLGVMWSNGNQVNEGRRWALYLIAVAVVEGISSGASKYLFERSAQIWVDSIRIQSLEKIMHQPKSWFELSSNSPGRVSEILERNAEEMRNILGRFVPTILIVVVMVVTSIIWASVINWKLALVALAPLPLVTASIIGYSTISKRCEQKCNMAAEDSSAKMTEIFTNLVTIRSLSKEGYFGKRYKESVEATFSSGLRRAACSSVPFGLYQCVSFPLTALVFYYGTTLLTHQNGNTSAVDILKVMNLLLFSIGSSTDMLGTLPQISTAQAAATNLLAYLSLSADVSDGASFTVINPLPVRFNKVSLLSPTENCRILSDVTLSIEPGTCTAIVGSSGSGKSSLISILLGLSNVQSPQSITFSGIPLSQVNIHDLREKMSYVSQTSVLFPISVYENIAYGLPDTSPLRQPGNIHNAARQAGIHDFICSLPNGYSTILGDGGLTLSGGQSQRVNIAQALARQPALLVLDEPTSALDIENAAIVRQTIRQTMRNAKEQDRRMAIVLVTHNTEMMRVADNIIVLDDGRVVEEGSFSDLLLSGGAFRDLVYSSRDE